MRDTDKYTYTWLPPGEVRPTRRVTPKALQDDEGRTWVPADNWQARDAVVFLLGIAIGVALAWSYAAEILYP